MTVAPLAFTLPIVLVGVCVLYLIIAVPVSGIVAMICFTYRRSRREIAKPFIVTNALTGTVGLFNLLVFILVEIISRLGGMDSEFTPFWIGMLIVALIVPILTIGPVLLCGNSRAQPRRRR